MNKLKLNRGDWAFSMDIGWRKVVSATDNEICILSDEATIYSYDGTGRDHPGQFLPSLYTYDPINGTGPPHLKFKVGQVLAMWDNEFKGCPSYRKLACYREGEQFPFASPDEGFEYQNARELTPEEAGYPEVDEKTVVDAIDYLSSMKPEGFDTLKLTRLLTFLEDLYEVKFQPIGETP